MFRGKKYQQSAKLIDRSVQYDPTEALDLVVKGASAKFDETVELQFDNASDFLCHNKHLLNKMW